MKKKLYRKYLVIGVIVLFVGASITPNIGGNVGLYEKIRIGNETSFEDFSFSRLFFTENAGQFHEDVLFKVHTSAATVYLCQDEIVSVFSRPGEFESEVEVLSIVSRIVGANNDVTIQGEDVLPHHNNYFIGNDPDKWYTDVLNYEAVCYKNIYTGIDLKYYGYENFLKYDFIVSPGADTSVIKIQYEGIENLLLNSLGDIQIDTNFGSISESKPFIYQEINGVKQKIEGRYIISEPGVFGFAIDESYDSLHPLIIDPTLVYSTYLGGADYDIGREIEVDSSGNAYIIGETASVDFPLQNPYQGNFSLLVDAFVTKLSSTGGSLIYSTYLGGSSHDYGAGIDIDNNGLAGITGTTFSNNFPTFAAHFPNLNGIQDAFVARLNANGNGLIYSTYLGGEVWEWGLDIAVDGNGCAYVTGNTNSLVFPVSNPYSPSNSGGFDIFVTKFDPPGGILLYSTYLGGNNHDLGEGIDIDSNGNAYVTGSTMSTNFPVIIATAYDWSYNGGEDICIAILDTVTGGTGSLVYGTYIFGQGDDYGYDIVIDNNNICYVTGWTFSTINQFFPVTSNAYQQFLFGTTDAYFFKLDTSLPPANQMLYCSYLGGMTGGGGNDVAHSIDLDSNNNAYIAGFTECIDFPTVNSLHPYKGNNEAFASLFDPSAVGSASLLDSTYIGGTDSDEGHGIAVDNNNDAYVTGLTYSTDFPTQNPYQGSNNGLGDAFVTKIMVNISVPEPELDCVGDLTWTGVKPGKTVTDSFNVSNIGDSGSELDWDITEWPDWGDWTFNPTGGTALKPEDGPVTVQVTVVAPQGVPRVLLPPRDTTYTGEVKVVNLDDSSDFCIIDVSLTTPKNRVFNINLLFLRFLENHPHMFPIFRQMLGL